MTTTISWPRFVLRSGLLLGVAVALVNLGASLSNTYTSGAWFWVVIVLELVAAVMLGLAMRETHSAGPLTRIAHVWLRIVAVFILAATVLAPATWLTLTFVTPDYADVFAELARTRYRAGGLSGTELEQRVADLASRYRPHLQAGYVFVGTVMTGVLFGLIAALIQIVPGPAGSRKADGKGAGQTI